MRKCSGAWGSAETRVKSISKTKNAGRIESELRRRVKSGQRELSTFAI